MGSMLIEGASGPASPAALACAREVDAYFQSVIAALEVVRDGLAEVCSREALLAADLVASAHPLTRDLLDGLPLFGGGFVAAPGFLADHHLYLAWWQGEEQQLLAQSAVSGSGDPVDYGRVEWYRTPVESGRPHVTGPYVDYVCSDEYMLTTTLPVEVDGRVVGVVGADTLLDTFESLMLGAVREAGATVVNQAFRVVLSADPRVPTGRLVAPEQRGALIPCGELPLSVLIG
ncbi:hypothetical protein ASE01_15765 [Nocardioides sp. Root190]|uniref:PDC sensor domain-containing protein n=1 Tax=Nocardioides sp. Root190 TaxID=1736488 RepID=UPI0006FE9D0A|nr:hypothetical protein [Nocardioides sp. Root190]KRB76420.1 hypothetical protein ASE01_15765 [Nocardioides sp. Root190]